MENNFTKAIEDTWKYLCRVTTGEIIEFERIEDCDDGFVNLYGARFSHQVTFGGERWFERNKFTVAKNNIVYILDQDS